MYSDMSSRTIARLVVKQKLRERASSFSFTDTGWTKKDERADRTIWILQASACTPDGICDRGQCFFLSDHALAQALFHRHQLLHLAFEHSRNRNAGPASDDLRDLFFVNFVLQ